MTQRTISPAEFRERLHIRGPAGKVRLADVAADFQVRDFEAMDPAFEALARGDKRERQCFWLERTKGASKDSDLAVMLCWLLATGRPGLHCQVGADDADQAGELRRALCGC